MFKLLVKLFIAFIFLLLLYSIFSQENSSKSEKIVVENSKKVSKMQKEKRKEKEIPKEIMKRNKKQFSLAESIEQIGGHIGDPVFIRIFKEEAVLELWMKHAQRYHLIQQYPICAFSGDLGPKLKEGDRQSPEGFYYVTKSRLNPNSRFHLSFNLGYPNRYDRAYGRTGSYLMVHGECASIGCYAMTNSKIEEIYELVEQALNHGQKVVRVHAFPFVMSVENMNRYKNHKWVTFWENLKEGYDWFESQKIPPNVEVNQRRYIFD